MRALADETAHAKLAFAIAAELDGHASGPGLLELAEAFSATTLSEVTQLVFREGGVGETVAALAAREAAAHATAPALRRVLERIADDETRRAELAWRFVRWALAQQARALADRRSRAATRAGRAPRARQLANAARRW